MAKFLNFLKKNHSKNESYGKSDVVPEAESKIAESAIQESENALSRASIDTEKLSELESDEKKGMFSGLRRGLLKTRANLVSGISAIFLGKKTIDPEILSELEAQLISADVGVNVSKQLIAELTKMLNRKELNDIEALIKALKHLLTEILIPCEKPLVISDQHKPFVILFVGVNGSGKTTTIGKLAKQLQEQGKKALLAAGDTFRAAAVQQLQVWGQRNEIPVITQQTNADSAAVIFDAYQAAKARGVDVMIADTAGRLHTKTNLMDELRKIKRILSKIDQSSPHEVMLVLDASNGQNALNQAQQFNEAIGVSGVCLTKLDGTAKGGIIFAIAKQLQLPIRFIGVGEKINDLREFKASEFVDALFSV
jgi:fused signal recognition particle receptor